MKFIIPYPMTFTTELSRDIFLDLFCPFVRDNPSHNHKVKYEVTQRWKEKFSAFQDSPFN
jgi:hypothetical protein